jgi:hypothetical protein
MNAQSQGGVVISELQHTRITHVTEYVNEIRASM